MGVGWGVVGLSIPHVSSVYSLTFLTLFRFQSLCLSSYTLDPDRVHSPVSHPHRWGNPCLSDDSQPSSGPVRVPPSGGQE